MVLTVHYQESDPALRKKKPGDSLQDCPVTECRKSRALDAGYRKSRAVDVGSVYAIAGLESEVGRELNGRWCEVKHYDSCSGRYCVCMHPHDRKEDFKKIKAEYLRKEPLASYTDEDVCRICHEGGSAEALVAPCACRGSMKWVHLSCVQSWYETSWEKDMQAEGQICTVARPCCDTCQIDYAAPLQIMLMVHARTKIGELIQESKLPAISKRDEFAPVLAHIDSELASSYLQIENVGKACELYERAIAVLRDCGLWHQLVDALEGYACALGHSTAEYLMSGNTDAYQSSLLRRAGLFEESYRVISSNHSPSSPHAAKCLRLLCGVQHELGMVTDAWKSAREAMRILEKQTESQPAVALEKAYVLRDMATFKWMENDPDEAKELLHRCLSLLRRFLGPTHRAYLAAEDLLERISAEPFL